MKRSTRIAAAVVLAAIVPMAAAGAQVSPVQPYGTNDGGVTVRNILPPGQGRYLNTAELLLAQTTGEQPPHNTDQLAMYENLAQATPGLTAADLADYFKDATFGVEPDNIERTYEPRPGVTVLRDTSFGVPHIYGTTRSDTMFGTGYVSAEDRLFMMDTLRHIGRGNLTEFLGASEANLAMDRAAYATAGYTEEELQEMIDHLDEVDPVRGAQAQQDVQDYTDGVNQFIAEAIADPSLLPGEYPALQVTPEDWKPTDTAAVASLIGSQLGVGGGSELQNAAFLTALEKEYSKKKARSIFDDLRFAQDPESPATATKRFPWNNHLGKVNNASVAIPDDPAVVAKQEANKKSFGFIDGPLGKIQLAFPSAMSNAVLVNGDHSKSGRPIAVIGPQVGYWSPQILMELDIHGPGIDARGVGFPGISMYVLLGRGADYAWSATSAGGDLVDTFAERLCNPEGGAADIDSTYYKSGDDCVEMYTRTDQWMAKPSAGGLPDPGGTPVQVTMTTQRTDDGIVQARGTVHGEPVAFVAKRSSFGSEVDSALTYIDIQNPDIINDARDFQEAFGRFAFTFNWFYVDGEDISYELGGYHPIRARHTDPDFPVWGTPKWSWTGMLPFEKTPKSTSPKQGYLVSWNNRPAHGFKANDGQWSYGPIYRSQLLEDPVRSALEDGKRLNLMDLVNVMGSAATQDLRGYRVLPYMLRALGKQNDVEMKNAVKLLRAWAKSGAHREATTPGGDYEHSAAISLMDAWWPKAVDAVFAPKLGEAYAEIPLGYDNSPGPVGSAYQSGFYGQIQKDLRALLGDHVRSPFANRYCGKVLKVCSKRLRASLRAAIAELTAEFGSDPDSWDADEDADRIEFAPVGIQGQDSMQWQNRPTFQQVLEFNSLD